jgi:hypothetical protein
MLSKNVAFFDSIDPKATLAVHTERLTHSTYSDAYLFSVTDINEDGARTRRCPALEGLMTVEQGGAVPAASAFASVAQKKMKMMKRASLMRAYAKRKSPMNWLSSANEREEL